MILMQLTGLLLSIAGIAAGVLALFLSELKPRPTTKYTLVAIIFGLTIYAAMGSVAAMLSPSSEDSETATSVPIAINSQQGWQSTELYVTAGAVVSVKVVAGEWSIYQSKVWLNSGTSADRLCSEGTDPNLCPLKSSRVGSLIGRIGDTKFEIGNSCIFFARSSGIIDLRINDTILSDNSGVLAVLVTSEAPGRRNADETCGSPAQ